MDEPIIKDDLEGMLTNPFYAVTFAPHMLKKHSNLGPKEDWVAANAHTMKDIGPKAWLNDLLDVLSQSRAKYDGHDIVNPSTVINISDRLAGDHEPLVTRKLWAEANEKMIKEMGAEAWLWRLLETLETGGPAAKS